LDKKKDEVSNWHKACTRDTKTFLGANNFKLESGAEEGLGSRQASKREIG